MPRLVAYRGGCEALDEAVAEFLNKREALVVQVDAERWRWVGIVVVVGGWGWL